MRNFIAILSVVFLTSCQTSEKPTHNRVSEKQFAKTDLETVHPGKKLMKEKCYICHSVTANSSNRIAPPMIAIKKHYISKTTTKKEFTEALQRWITDPTKEKAKMKGAVKRFGVMPKTPFSKETIRQIADYMFDNNIEQPKWFQNHFKKMNNNKNE